jgi:hypothetical protein
MCSVPTRLTSGTHTTETTDQQMGRGYPYGNQSSMMKNTDDRNYVKTAIQHNAWWRKGKFTALHTRPHPHKYEKEEFR